MTTSATPSLAPSAAGETQWPLWEVFTQEARRAA